MILKFKKKKWKKKNNNKKRTIWQEECLGNQLEGEIDIEDIPGISSSIENEHITLPISEIYGDAALD